MGYKEIVRKIANLNWKQANPGDIIILSHGTAKEFAESLRLGLKLYPDDSRLTEMASGELKTDNMAYDDYHSVGDHWEFLDFFIKKFKIEPSKPEIVQAIEEYTKVVRGLSDEDRAMTIFSREEELTAIFENLVKSHNWDKLGFGFYRYYLQQHIFFDSGEGGHHHLTMHFPLHEEILDRFYEIRLKLYSCLF